jgi:large subunit ribosomal protein L13
MEPRQKSYVMKPAEVKPEWHVVDASEYVLGRMATRIALILQGKHKPTYTPHVDTGDFVVVINAKDVQVTGRKRENKIYQHYTGWVGGRKTETFAHLNARKPEQIIELAVRRMLPKSRLGRQMLSKLKIYAGPEHPHESQQPKSKAL